MIKNKNIQQVTFLNNLLLFFFSTYPVCFLVGNFFINLYLQLINLILVYGIFKNFYTYKILNRQIIYLLLFLFFSFLVNLIFSNNMGMSFLRIFKFLLIIGSIIAFKTLITNLKTSKINKMYKIWFIIFLVVILDIVFEIIFGFNILGFKSFMSGRIASFTGDELKIGGFYFGFILLSLTYIKYNKSNWFIFFLIAFFVTAYLIGERSNFIKIFLMILPFYFILYNSNVFKKIFYLSIPVIIILLITIADAKFKQRFFYYFINPIIKNNLEESLSKDKHISHYRLAIDIFKNNKLFGVGIKNFRHESYHRSVNLGHKIAVTTHPHQIHLEFLSEIGIIGYILLMSFLFYTIFNGFLIYRTKNDITALSATLFIIATILPILPSGSFFTTYGATIFWINFSFICRHKYNYNK